MHTTVVITLFNDVRVLNTINSLRNQNHKPDKILIADGGSPPEIKEVIDRVIKNMPTAEFVLLPGRCIDTRRQVINLLLDETDIIAFIDSDEEASFHWLEKLIEPITLYEADFTGGPTYWKNYPQSKPEQILTDIIKQAERQFSEDITYLGMGNSAWHTKIFKKIGNFDNSSNTTSTDKDSIAGSYHVSDDYDINIRATDAGFKGLFVRDAYVYHDQAHIDTFKKLLKYFYGQYVRTSMAYFKHKKNLSKFTNLTKRLNITHPFVLVLMMIKPIAMLHGWKEWQQIAKN